MHDTLWQSALGEIELSVSAGNFKTWFKDTKIISSDDQEVVIAVKNIFAKKQFEARFNDLVTNVLKNNGISPKLIRYVVSLKDNQQTVSRETTINRQPDDQSPNLSVDKDGSLEISSNHLNPRYTFDNFIVGSSNDLAYTAGQAVASHPGTKYNPIYFYGGVGLGKTHLMQAIGNEIIKKQPKKRILYISSETFVNEFLEYVRFKKKGFANKYRNVDVLIVDDMQFIAGKEKTQEEFFHTFNHLHQHNKQIIISSDKPPRSIPTLTERLRSRFEMGMAIDIQMPDFETRCAIITAKADLSGLSLNPETVDYLATNIKTNVRELEGALNQLIALAEMRGVEPTVDIASSMLNNIQSSRPRHVSAHVVVDKTARHFGLKIDEIKSSKRNKHIVMPRQIAMYLLRSELHYSFPKVAIELGRKDHTTAIHAIEKITRELKLNQEMREHVSMIQENIYG